MDEAVHRMGPVTAIRTCLRKYATFSGRATRAEYWWFWLFSGSIIFAAAELDLWIFGTPRSELGWLWRVTYYTSFLPSMAVGVRRLHDRGHAAWHYVAMWIVLELVSPWLFFFGPWPSLPDFSWRRLGGLPTGVTVTPAHIFIGAVIAYGVWLFLALILPSKPGTNRFGPDPLGGPAATEAASAQ